MTVQFLDEARAEIREAIAHYDEQRPGLGDEFLIEVQRAAGRIASFPNAWPMLSRATRRCRASRFPYGLVYQVRADHILIVAVMHLHRRAGYWRDRV